MKILISTDKLTSIRDNEEARLEWDVDRIMIWENDINDSLENLPQSQGDITFLIPTIFNPGNALAYEGATIALRILFRYLINRGKGVGIVLLGFESKEAFLMHYSHPNILKIPGIQYCIFNKKVVSRLSEPPTLGRDRYRTSITNLGLSMPSSFKSSHSLTNEWSIYKWATYMGFEDLAGYNLPNLLYLDYIKVVEKIDGVTQKSLKNNPNLQAEILKLKGMSSKILLVDDNEGWHRFFKEFFKDSKIEFEAIGVDFKKKTFDEISQAIYHKVESFSPDVVLLDFRLLEDKDANSDFKEISGVKILRSLKGSFQKPGIAFGRQILIFTATSRIENILRLKKLNADGFILKEKTDQYASKEISKDLIVKLVYDIKNAIIRAQFLIPLNRHLDILSFIAKNKEYDQRVRTVAESVRALTQQNEVGIGILKLAYLNLFGILEFIKPSDCREINSFVQDSSKDNDDIRNVLPLWNNICNMRNSLAHGNKSVWIDRRKANISSILLQEWTVKLCEFIEKFLKGVDNIQGVDGN